jgi:hypothetical protein
MNGAFIARLFNKHPDTLRYSRKSLIRCALAALGTRQSCCHRVPSTQGLRKRPAKAELASMLPGFRFLFAAIVLSMSMLVFGLGAAALLRAAHEEFASTPSWHASPEPVFAQQTETTRPVLAMLHAEPPAAEEKAPDQAATAVTPPEQPATSTTSAEPETATKSAEPEVTARPSEPEVTAAPAESEITRPAEPEKTAALQPENSSPPETAKPDMPVAESPPQQEPVPAQAIAPAVANEPKTTTSTLDAASEQVAPAASEAAPAAPEQAGQPAPADLGIASAKIATLGGPPVTIEAAPAAKPTVAKHEKSNIRKRVEARRKARHRRLALRARVMQQLSQQAPDPFGQQFTAARRR